MAPGPERPGVRESRTARWERLKHTFSCPIPKQGHCAASPERSLPGPQGWLEVLGWAGVDTTAGRWLPGTVQGPHTNFTWNQCQARGVALGKGIHSYLEWHDHPCVI